MKKNIINTILVTEDFFEAATFRFKKDRLVQQNFVGASLDSTQKKASSEIIKSTCQTKGIDFKKGFFAVTPKSQVTIKNFELPSTNSSEIEQMVFFQLQDSLPYRIEDLIIQNLITPSSKEGYSQAMSIVAQRELINNFLELMKLSKIKISKIDISSTVLLNRYKMIYEKELFFKKTNLLINVESECVDFIFIKNGRILLSRGLLFKKDNFEDSFYKEVGKSLSLFHHKFSDKLSESFLWGRRPNLERLANSISTQTNLKTHIKEDENLLTSLAHCSYKEKGEINLMPAALKDKQKSSLERKSLLRIVSSIAGIILFLTLAVFFDFKEKKEDLATINHQIKKIESDATEIHQKKIMIERAFAKQAQTLQSLEILAELYSITQPGVFFNSFSLTPAKSAIIKGQADGLDKILEFISRLESSNLFENVKLKYSSKRRLKKKEIIDFEIAFFISRLSGSND